MVTLDSLRVVHEHQLAQTKSPVRGRALCVYEELVLRLALLLGKTTAVDGETVLQFA
jgi:hypothetical protein